MREMRGRGLRAAVILPRYGASLGGGAETLTRELVLKLREFGVFSSSEVWTTCAIDHRTWKNELPTGESFEDGMIVRRFPVDERDLEPFIAAEHALARGEALPIEGQLSWIENGVNSRELYLHILGHHQNYDILLFAPYLFPTSFWGPWIAPEKSVIIPCLHDEAYAYNAIFAALFNRVRGFFFNAEGEKRLANQIYPDSRFDERSAVVGMGFADIPVSDSAIADSFGLKRKEYLLYSGRKETGKNLPLLLNYYERLDSSVRSRLPLVLIGSGILDFRSSLPEGVIDLGFVAEEEKLSLMAGALALCQPSTNESFSIVLLESFLQETPGLVHSDCAVTREHVLSADGGLFFKDGAEFAAAVCYLLENPAIAGQLGRQARQYVLREYSWSSVVGRASRALELFGLAA